MNWFQRYTIPGAYFIIWISIICIPNVPHCHKVLKDIIPLIIVAVIPLGYILLVLSRLVYYMGLFNIFKPTWPKSKNCTKKDLKNELDCETV